MAVHPQRTLHPGGHSKHRKPGPHNGKPTAPDGKDANGPAGGRSKAKEPVSPLLTAAPLALTAEIMGEIVDTTKVPDVNVLVKNLNDMVAAAKIKTALAQAMIIAQVAAESGRFTTVRSSEDADGLEVYNPNENVSPAFKQAAPVFGKNATARYLPHPKQRIAWEVSQAAYLKAKAAYVAAQPKGQPFKDFDLTGQWKPTKITDYLPGDLELPRWKLLYDPESPRQSRADMAKRYENTVPGDGRKYRGRGYVQLTWCTNYKRAEKDLKIDGLTADPDKASEPTNATQIAGWYWLTHRGNADAVADTDAAFDKVTADINGGSVGAAIRKSVYVKAKAAILKRLPTLPEK